MKKHKGKTKRWLAGILSAVLVIGSINLVNALEGSNGESALYDAPELTITQGATDYDLMKDITYDSSLYELAVVNDGGFDVNTVGDYEVTYSLTSKDDGTLDPENPGDTSDADNENKDQNSGDNQGSDNTQTGDNSDASGSGSNTDNTDSSDSSDSSNAGDNADAGQGDTSSDSSNAEDTADADETDSTDDTKDSQNTENENSADADTVNITEEQTPKAANIGVLGVSRPRTGVDMNYQSEPVGAEAVDVTKGEDTNTVDTQEKQVITFTRTVHVVAASEDKESVYVAQELVLIQGEEDYDLTDDILYDDEKYTLEVVELGGFDINKIGSYEVTYSLTPVTTEGTQGNGQDDTQENQVITFQRTVTVKAAGEENVLYEAPELVLKLAAEEYDLTEGIIYDSNCYKLNIVDIGDFDIYTLGDYEVSYSLVPIGDVLKEEESNDKNSANMGNSTDELNVNNSADSNMDNIEVGNESSVMAENNDVTGVTQEDVNTKKTITFQRMVYVVSDYDGQVSTLSLFDGSTTTQGIFVTELGTPLWLDETKNQFTFPHATVTTQEVDKKVTSISIYINTANVTIESTANMTDNNKTFATWIFQDNGGLTAEEAQSKLREIIYKDQRADKTAGIDIRIDVDGNETSANMTGNQLTYYPNNGHYYMYIKGNIPWTDAYNNAKSYTFQGMKGYLATVMSQDEMIVLRRIVSSNGGYDHLGGARYSGINDADSLNGLSYSPLWPGSGYKASVYYWVCGPEGKPQTNIPWGLWTPGEPNIGEGSGIWEYNVCIIKDAIKLNDLANNTGYSRGYYVEFGGYAEGQDPGGRNDGCVSHIVFKDQVHAAEAQIGTDKYYPLCAAIDIAKDGETVEIISDTVTEGESLLVKGAMLKTMDGKTYKSNTDSHIAVDTNSNVTLKDGVLEMSSNTTLKVLNNVDNQIYTVTTPGCTSVVSTSKDGDSPNIRGANDGIIKIGNAGEEIAYTYKNPNSNTEAVVYIPDAMADNGQVTKAELSADKVVVIQVDDGQTVLMKGTGSTSDTVSVERRSRDQKLDVNLPAGASATAFGHEIGAAPAYGVKVSQASTNNVSYPNRDYITLTSIGDSITVDNVTYTASDADQKLYLGTFQVDMTIGNHAKVNGSTPALPHYLEEYTITICPDTGYDLDKDNFVLTMKENDTADAKNLTFATYCTEESDGSIKVTIPKVTGDITIHAEAKKQTSKLTIDGLDVSGTVKVLDGEGQVHELKKGKDSVTVNRNEELTLTFIPDDFTEPYYGDLTGEKGSSFSILTGLKDNTPGAAVAELFTQDVKDSFNWTEKSYQVKYTPDKAVNTLEATFTHSSIMHVHVTGGTAEVNTPGLVQNPTDTGSFRHVIVPDHTQVQVTLKDTTGHNPVYKAAYWKQASTAGGNDTGTEVSSQLNDAGSKTYTYTTQAVSASHMLNVSFEQGQNVDVTFTGGNASLVQPGTTSWTDQGNHTYRTLVKNGNTLTMKVQVNEGYGLKSITVNGYTINATAALNNPDYNVTYDEATRTYTHTTKPIDQAWNVVMDFEEQYTVSFVDQKDRALGSIPAVNGTTIPEEKFTEMQAKTDAQKEGNEIFLTWVDKADGNAAYNKNTIITKNNLVLKPVYRKNAGNGGHIENGSDGSILAADDFAIHLRDLQNLTADNVKDEKYANVTAFDKDGAKVTAQVTVDADELAALKTKSAGTYRNALTFTYNKLSVKVTVEISDAEVTITGRTAHTLTFTGKGGVTYQVQKSDENGGSLTGNVMSAATAAGTGKGTADGLDKAAYYLISHKAYGQAVGRTSLVDAQDIAKQFADDGDQTTTNGKTDKSETASNQNVDVTVDDNGNYKVTLKKNIDHTVEIPDTWENVKIDLGGHTITGDNADASKEAKPGLVFKKDDTATEHPGTNLEIVNGTIQGGSGSAAHPDGAAGVGEAAGSKPSQAGITVGADAVIKGGNGADGENGSNGGNGGSGIEGTIGTTVNGGSVFGGNGGKGSDSATGTPGNGGNGGSGIKTDKDVVINGGTITGGNAGNGGNATGENNTNPGGSGGNGGSGVNSGNGKIDNNGGTITGGDAGNGGSSEKGNGGTGGNGGSGSIGETNNTNGGTTTGGNGGNGGNSNNGGNNGNGGSGGKGTDGTVNGGDQNGNNGQDGKIFFVILFKDQKQNPLNAVDPCKVAANGKITKDYFDKMQEKTDAKAEADEKFFAWTEENNADKVYTAETEITASVTLVPVYRADSNVVPGQDGNTIAADNFSIRIEKVSSLTETEAKKLANVKAYDKKGADITNTVTVDQDKLSALQQSTAGIYPDALTFEIPGSVKVSVTVEITDDNPVITGKTAHTLTFKGRANETYEYQELDAQGTPTGNVLTILTNGDGKATITGLKKATPYQISHKKYGSVNGRTALVDAKDIAKQFEDRGAGDTTGNNATDRTEKAENSNVQVVVDDDGNYKVIVKKDIDHTVEIPDTWGEVKIDLGGHTITGDKADDNNAAKPGLDFVKDGSINEHPGTKLEIVNGTIKGGDGSAKHPDGAPGIGASGDTADAGLIIGSNANVIGGNGADGTEGKDGGNGGAGIDGNGKITPTVNGTVTGGNGGKGGDSAAGIPGNGGNGGNGISAGDKTITINHGGTVKGGDAGKGGNATGDNTNPGGNGGNGGTGTETTQPGKTDNNGGTTSGGNGGDGGTSNNGNGGNGGDGGSGSTGENNNNGGTSSGGNGGNGGDSNNGTGGNGGNNSGGNGGNGGDSNSGNGGSGGNGGDYNSGTGGNGGNGGDSNNGTGGNGGNGGGSNNGTGGNGGNGGNSNNGNGGNGGNGGDSNSGNNGNGGSSGSNGNRPGGNGGGSNNGNGGNGGNNGGDNSGNNGGGNGGNNGGDNSNNNSGNTGNTPDAGNTAGNDSGNNAHKGNKGNSTGNSNAGQKDPAEDDSLNDAADESSLTGDADGSDADGSDADGIQEEESIHADSDSVENGTDSDSHIPFGECGFHWIPIVWLLVILGYTVVRVKKLRDESEEA